MSESTTDTVPEPRSEAWTATASEPADDETPQSDETPQTLDAARKLRRENQSLRTRLHDMERAEVERLAAQDLIDPSDVWQASEELQGFYDEEFKRVTADKVHEATQAIIAAKPHLAKPKPTPPPTDRPIEGLRGGASPEVRKPPVTWSSALRG